MWAGFHVIKASENRRGMKGMLKVRDLMVSDVVTIAPSTSVVDAARRMIQEEKGPLPIVEGDPPVAIITDHDTVAHCPCKWCGATCVFR